MTNAVFSRQFGSTTLNFYASPFPAIQDIPWVDYRAIIAGSVSADLADFAISKLDTAPVLRLVREVETDAGPVKIVPHVIAAQTLSLFDDLSVSRRGALEEYLSLAFQAAEKAVGGSLPKLLALVAAMAAVDYEHYPEASQEAPETISEPLFTSPFGVAALRFFGSPLTDREDIPWVSMSDLAYGATGSRKLATWATENVHLSPAKNVARKVQTKEGAAVLLPFALALDYLRALTRAGSTVPESEMLLATLEAKAIIAAYPNKTAAERHALTTAILRAGKGFYQEAAAA